MLIFSIGCFAQDSTKVTKLYEWPYAYVEFGLGGMIPTDNSNGYFGMQFEIGKFLNPVFGVGLEFQSGSESEYHDHLSYIGLNTRYRLNPAYNPDKLVRFEATAGIGYGWYSYLTGYDYDYWGYYDEFRTKYSYVVPKIGVNAYVNIARGWHVGVGPEFAWYISTNKDNSANVAVINIFGKIKYNF